ncbi:MAG: glycosyltransferase 87 family protein [Bifidobacteriaceae bacterium]|jgi:hypothetical protein|nr:glycosyltransferase 87 family protein [Bifidobacteriaceae bacterium]
MPKSPNASAISTSGHAWTVCATILAFTAAHIAVLVASQTSEPHGAGDVSLYESWMDFAIHSGGWPVFNFKWVYPVVALVPMAVAWALAALTGLSYLSSWWLMVTLLDFAAGGLLVRSFGWRRAATPVLAWSAFMALMGGPGLMRLDALVPPLILTALLIAGRHPAVAAAVLTVGAWIKVAPGVVVVPLLAVFRRRWREILVGGGVVSAAVALAVLVAGAGPGSLFGFVSSQSGRGLQVESIAATPFVLARAATGQPLATYNDALSTWELDSSASPVVGRVCDIALPLALIAIAWLSYRARRRRQEAMIIGTLAALGAAIVANKVGSPQFMDWLVAPVLMGLARRPRSEAWRVAAALLGVCAALTRLIFPVAYGWFLEGDAGMVAVAFTRNAIVVAIFVASVVKLSQLGSATAAPIGAMRSRGRQIP